MFNYYYQSQLPLDAEIRSFYATLIYPSMKPIPFEMSAVKRLSAGVSVTPTEKAYEQHE